MCLWTFALFMAGCVLYLGVLKYKKTAQAAMQG